MSDAHNINVTNHAAGKDHHIDPKDDDANYNFTKGASPYSSVMSLGDANLAESFNDFINFADVLQQQLLSSVTKLLESIAKRTEKRSDQMNSSLQTAVDKMNHDKGDQKQFSVDQQNYNKEQQYFSNLLQQLGSIRDRVTQNISGINSQTSNLFSGTKSINDIYTRM